MVDTLKKCTFTGSSGDLALEFESSSGVDKSIVIDPKGILELIFGIQEVTQEANEQGRNCSGIEGLMPFGTSFELYQYKFFTSKDMSHLILHFLNKDNSSYGFPLTRKDAKQLGEDLIEQAESLNEEAKSENKSVKLRLIK